MLKDPYTHLNTWMWCIRSWGPSFFTAGQNGLSLGSFFYIFIFFIYISKRIPLTVHYMSSIVFPKQGTFLISLHSLILFLITSLTSTFYYHYFAIYVFLYVYFRRGHCIVPLCLLGIERNIKISYYLLTIQQNNPTNLKLFLLSLPLFFNVSISHLPTLLSFTWQCQKVSGWYFTCPWKQNSF